KTLVLTLKKIALAGRTVVCTIHQPRIDIWNEFDNVLLLMTEGRLAYAGKASDAIAYFDHAGYVLPEGTNAADTVRQHGRYIYRVVGPLTIVEIVGLFFWRMGNDSLSIYMRLGCFQQMAGGTLPAVLVALDLYPRQRTGAVWFFG
ncbi:ATP-binding cassette sub- G member 1, partial [Mortierella alpina]